MKTHVLSTKSVIAMQWSHITHSRKLPKPSNQKRALIRKISPSPKQRIPKIKLHPRNLQKKKLAKKQQKPRVRHQLRQLKRMQSQNLKTRNQPRVPKLPRPHQRAPSLKQLLKILKNQLVQKKKRLHQLKGKRRKVPQKLKLLIQLQLRQQKLQ